MTRHLADKQDASTGGRVQAFMRIAREDRATESALGWHRRRYDRQAARDGDTESDAHDRSSSRLTQFLRILRGRLS